MKTFRLSESRGPHSPDVAGFFDPRTFSVQYIVTDPATRKCAIIDPVLDYDEKSGATATRHADELLAYIRDQGLEVQWILDTHPHADHFSAAQYLKDKTGAPTAIGAAERAANVRVERAQLRIRRGQTVLQPLREHKQSRRPRRRLAVGDVALDAGKRKRQAALPCRKNGRRERPHLNWVAEHRARAMRLVQN